MSQPKREHKKVREWNDTVDKPLDTSVLENNRYVDSYREECVEMKVGKEV